MCCFENADFDSVTADVYAGTDQWFGVEGDLDDFIFFDAEEPPDPEYCK